MGNSILIKSIAILLSISTIIGSAPLSVTAVRTNEITGEVGTEQQNYAIVENEDSVGSEDVEDKHSLDLLSGMFT